MLYPILLIIHLTCAIIFLGYIFCDVVLLNLVRKHLGDEWADKTWSVVMPRGRKIMPVALLLLIITGFGMITNYISFKDATFFESSLSTLLSIKMSLGLLIFVLAFISIITWKIKKKEIFYAKYLHQIVLILGAVIIILAKLAFYI